MNKVMLKQILNKDSQPLYPDRCNRLINEKKCNFKIGEDIRVVYEELSFWNGTTVVDFDEDDYGYWINTSDGKKYDFVYCDDNGIPWIDE